MEWEGGGSAGGWGCAGSSTPVPAACSVPAFGSVEAGKAVSSSGALKEDQLFRSFLGWFFGNVRLSLFRGLSVHILGFLGEIGDDLDVLVRLGDLDRFIVLQGDLLLAGLEELDSREVQRPTGRDLRLPVEVREPGSEVEGEDLADVRADVEVLHCLLSLSPLLGSGSLPDVGRVGLPLAAHLAGGNEGVEIGLQGLQDPGDALGLHAVAVQLRCRGLVAPLPGAVSQGTEAFGEPPLSPLDALELAPLGRRQLAALAVADSLPSIVGPQQTERGGGDADAFGHLGIGRARPRPGDPQGPEIGAAEVHEVQELGVPGGEGRPDEAQAGLHAVEGVPERGISGRPGIETALGIPRRLGGTGQGHLHGAYESPGVDPQRGLRPPTRGGKEEPSREEDQGCGMAKSAHRALRESGLKDAAGA